MVFIALSNMGEFIAEFYWMCIQCLTDEQNTQNNFFVSSKYFYK